MRVTDFINESEQKQLEQLTEGPLGSLGKAIGKGLGGIAKGAGAVAGGVAGIGSAFKKGYQSGKATVSGDDEPAQPQQAVQSNQGQASQDKDDKTPNQQNTAVTPKPTVQPKTDADATPKPTVQPQDKTVDNKPMAGSGSETTQSTNTAKETEYAKALKFVKGLPVAQQKELVAMLQKDSKVTSAMNRPAAGKDAEEPTKGLSPEKFGQMAQSLAGAAQKAPEVEPKIAPTKDGSKSNTAEPDLTDPNVPISQAIKRRQAQGLAAGYKNPNTMIKEQFSLFRK